MKTLNQVQETAAEYEGKGLTFDQYWNLTGVYEDDAEAEKNAIKGAIGNSLFYGWVYKGKLYQNHDAMSDAKWSD